jgi:predicted RNase H-like nuclease (RuvC/YqgF family)
MSSKVGYIHRAITEAQVALDRAQAEINGLTDTQPVQEGPSGTLDATAKYWYDRNRESREVARERYHTIEEQKEEIASLKAKIAALEKEKPPCDACHTQYWYQRNCESSKLATELQNTLRCKEPEILTLKADLKASNSERDVLRAERNQACIKLAAIQSTLNKK